MAILAAIGAFLGAQAGNAILDNLGQFSEMDIPFEVPSISPIGAALNALIGAFVAWAVWSALTYFVITSYSIHYTKLYENKAEKRHRATIKITNQCTICND